jgi:hypothetical protein
MRQMFFASEVSTRNKHRLAITSDKRLVGYFVWPDLIALGGFRFLCSGRTSPYSQSEQSPRMSQDLLTTTLLLIKPQVGAQEGPYRRFISIRAHADRLTALGQIRVLRVQKSQRSLLPNPGFVAPGPRECQGD